MSSAPKRTQNILLIIGVIVLALLPLWIVERPAAGPDGEVAIFGGADDQAKDAIMEIAPAYEPWFEPLIEPASGEIASLLFALQAALGAGVLGWWLGSSVTRTRMRREQAEAAAARAAEVAPTTAQIVRPHAD